MEFSKTPIPGAMIIDIEKVSDFRGFFARSWCQKEFSDLDLTAQFVQSNISFTKLKGTIRGLHYQAAPYGEAKLVRCVRGRIFDVIVDLRKDSRAYGSWTSIELGEGDFRQLYIPKGCAHGFQTLADHTEVTYQMSQEYVPEAAAGIRWDDPALNIEWPLDAVTINERDANYPDYVFSE